MKSLIRRFWQEEEAQGTTEYILIVLVVVGLAIIFRDRIKGAVDGKLGELSEQISGFSN